MQAFMATKGAFGAAWWFVRFSVSIVVIWALLYMAWFAALAVFVAYQAGIH